MKILVSACLMGMSCRYDGQSNLIPQLKKLMKTPTCIPVCAEIFGGLPTPRTPAERRGSTVVTQDGQDVTDAFVRGAAEILRLADLYHCKVALLKERSPSCGSGTIYDGTFTGTLAAGDGVTAELLKANGIKVIDENAL